MFEIELEFAVADGAEAFPQMRMNAYRRNRWKEDIFFW